MPKPKPIATRVACLAAVIGFLVLAPRSHAGTLAQVILLAGLLPALGIYLDWLRLERPSMDDAFFAAAAVLGALVVGLAPSGATALWHPVLLAVALTFALRRRVVAGSIVHVDDASLTLALDRGRLTVSRDAHEALGDRSPLILAEGAPLALSTRLAERSRGEGPFRSAPSLTHGAILGAASASDDLRDQRFRHAAIAVGLVVASAAVGWGAALADFTIGSGCRFG